MMPRNLKWLVFLLLLFIQVVSFADIFGDQGFIIKDLQGVNTFSQNTKLTTCSPEEYLLPVVLANDERGVIYKHLSIEISLPAGIELGSSLQRKVWLIDRDAMNSHPTEPYMQFAIDVSQHVSWDISRGLSNPILIINTAVPSGKVLLIKTGIQANCEVTSTSNVLKYAYTLHYSKYDEQGNTLGPEYLKMINGNAPLNNILAFPVWLVDQQIAQEQVVASQTFKRKVVLTQVGQFALTDSLFYSDRFASSIQIDPASVTVNGISVPRTEILQDNIGIQFPILSSLYDTDAVFSEGDSIIITYLITAGCMPGEVQSKISASWGCNGFSDCKITTSYFSFYVRSNGNPYLYSTEIATPYTCTIGEGSYSYQISNAGTYLQGFMNEAGARDIRLVFDDRNCTYIKYDRFDLLYKNIITSITPIRISGSEREFDISGILSLLGNSTLPADVDSFFILKAYFSSNCTNSADQSCYLNCNTICRKPFISLSYKDKCGSITQQVFHRDNGGTNPLPLPCNKPVVTFTEYVSPAQCQEGKFEYKLDLTNTGPVNSMLIRIKNNGCDFYTIRNAFINNNPYEVFAVNGGWEFTIPGVVSGSNKLVFELTGVVGGTMCLYPDVIIDKYNYCGSTNNSMILPYSGKSNNARIYNNMLPVNLQIKLTDEQVFNYCSPGFMEYTINSIQSDSIKDFQLVLNTGNCHVYDIDSIAINNKILPLSRWTDSDGNILVDIRNINLSGLIDLDNDGYNDDLIPGTQLKIKYYTSIGISNSISCNYPTLITKYVVCSSAINTTTLDMSGKPSTVLIKSPVAYPKVGIQNLTQTPQGWVSYCKEGQFSYVVFPEAVNKIYDLKFGLDTRGCNMYNVTAVKVNDYTLPHSFIQNIQGNITVDLNNTNLVPGLRDIDMDGFTDDATQLPIYITFVTHLNVFNDGEINCCRQPIFNMTYLLCGDFRDSVISVIDNSSYCLNAVRPNTSLQFGGYVQGGYCQENVFNYRVKNPSSTTLENIQLILDKNNSYDYVIDSIKINNRSFPSKPAYQNGYVFTFNMNEVNVPIQGFIDGADMDGKTDAFGGDSFNVQFIISPLNSLLNCSYPSFKILYGICNSSPVFDELKYSGLGNRTMIGSAINSTKITPQLLSYIPPSYCEAGSLNFNVQFERKDTIGGIKIYLDTRGNTFYAIDGFLINGQRVPAEYVTVSEGNYTIDLSKSNTIIAGLKDLSDADSYLDEADTSFTLKAIISLPPMANKQYGNNVEGIDGECRGPSNSSYWPSIVFSYDKCFEDRRFSDTLKYCGYGSGVLLMKDDNGISEGGISKFKTNADASTSGVRHDIYYKYSYTGIAPCPNDTQLVFRIEFPDQLNGKDSIDGFVLNYIDAPSSLMKFYNSGYIGHKTDTLFLEDGKIEKVILSIYFDQSAALALGPSSTPKEKKISFFSTGFLGSKQCDFVEFVPAKTLSNASLSFVGKDRSGNYHNRYERWCKDTLKVSPVRDIPPCPCPGEWVNQTLLRVSKGFQDSTMTSKSNITDNLDQGGACDTFVLSNILVKKSQLDFDTMYIAFDAANDPRLSNYDALKFSSVEDLIIKDNQNNLKGHHLGILSVGIGVGKYLLKLFNIDGEIPVFKENDSLILTTKWVSDISQLHAGGIATQQLATLFSYDDDYIRNTQMCLPGVIKSNYNIIHYNTESIKIINSHNLQDCKYKLQSVVLNNTNALSRPDYWPNEYRPMYYLDSIEVNIHGAELSVLQGNVKINSGSQSYTIPNNELVTRSDTAGTKLVFYNKEGKWPIKEYSKFKGDTLYSLNIDAAFRKCCYSLNGSDSSYSFTYYVNSLPGGCTSKTWSKTDSLSFNYNPNFVQSLKVQNKENCSFEFNGTISNTLTGSNNYPGYYDPSFYVDSVSFLIESLVNINDNITIQNNLGGIYSLNNNLQEASVRQDLQNGVTHVTLYNKGNWPLMIDSQERPDSLFTVSVEFGFTSCCYSFNQPIDVLHYTVSCSPLQGNCTPIVLFDSSEVLSVINDNDFYLNSRVEFLPSCGLSLNTDLFSTCDPEINNCYPDNIQPEYVLDSVIVELSNLYLNDVSGIVLGMPGSNVYSPESNQVKLSYDGIDTRITIVNTGMWPILIDTISGNNSGYFVNINTQFGTCCYQFEVNSQMHSKFFFRSKTIGCKNYIREDSIPLRNSQEQINIQTEDRFSFEENCSGSYSIAVKNDCQGDCPDDLEFTNRVWEIDSLIVTVIGQGIDPKGDIIITDQQGKRYVVSRDNISINTFTDSIQILLKNANGSWPTFNSGENKNDTLSLISLPFSFTTCCYAFTSADASAIFKYKIVYKDHDAAVCSPISISGTSKYNSYRNSGNLILNSSLETLKACSAALQGEISYSCPTGDCYSSGSLPEYKIDSIRLEVDGNWSSLEQFELKQYGNNLASFSANRFSNYTINGNTVSIFSFYTDSFSLKLNDENLSSIEFHFPLDVNICSAMSEDLNYRILFYYKTTDGECKQGLLSSQDSIIQTIHPKIDFSPIAGLRNQLSVNGKAVWTFDVERSDATSFVWAAVEAETEGIEDFKIYHVYNTYTGSDSLLRTHIVDNTILISGLYDLNKARFRIEATIANCMEQSVKIFAGTSCGNFPEHLTDLNNINSTCSTVMFAGNKVIVDNSDMQVTFIVDPTINGIKTCDTLEFVLELKNVNRGSTFNHDFNISVPLNYNIDQSGWSYIYPFNRETDIDLSTGSVTGNMKFFTPKNKGILSGYSQYGFGIDDLDELLGNQGLPGISNIDNSYTSVGIVFRIFTSCDFSEPGYIKAEVVADKTCKAEQLKVLTNTTLPKVDGIDLINPSKYTISLNDSLRSFQFCSDTINYNGIIIKSISNITVDGEYLIITLPLGTDFIRTVGKDQYGWDWDRASSQITSNGIEWRFQIPEGSWSEREFSFLFYTTMPPPGNYQISMRSIFQAIKQCNIQVDPCILEVNTSDEVNCTIQIKQCVDQVSDIHLNDDSIKLCDKYVQIFVLKNDTVTGNTIPAFISQQPFNGSVIIEGNSFIYIPDPDFLTGMDTFYYKICDARLTENCAEAMVVIEAGNCKILLPPIANDDELNIIKDSPALIDILNNDFDPDGEHIYICSGIESVIHRPVHGSINIVGDSIAIYSPNTGFVGTDLFSYEVCDIDGLRDTAQVSINVSEGNDCEMPNGFSPNDDGINDLLVVPCESNGPKKIHIWNRWGDELFYSTDYKNNWDGTYKGKKIPPGVYFYSLEFKADQESELRKSGYLVIYQ